MPEFDHQLGEHTFRVFDSETAGACIVFLHGNGGRWQHWQPQLDYFQKSFRVVAFDHLGYGASSPMPRDYTMIRQCDDTLALLNVLDIDKCHVVGLSMGGAAAQLVGMRSDVAISLCLAGIFRYDQKHETVTSRYQEMAARAQQPPPPDRSEFARMLFSDQFIADAPEQVDRMMSEFMSTDTKAAAVLAAPESAGALGKQPISDLTLPVLVVAGGSDYMAPLAAVRNLYEALPNASWALLEDAGHVMNIEQPQRFNRELASFLAQQKTER